VTSKEEKLRRKRLKDDYLRAEQVVRAVLMPLDRTQLEALLDYVGAAVEEQGCDHTRRATDEWARRLGHDLERLHEGLEEYGGFCDCEVVMNVDPDEIFTPTRSGPDGREPQRPSR
jgi:hypothetical protein